MFVSTLGMAACTPACTPPDAKNPDDSKAAQAADPNANESAKDDTEAPAPSGEMITEAKGVDLGKLSESQRSTFFQILNTEPSACDKPHSMAKSLRDDASCRNSLIAAQYVADRLAGGATPSAVKEELEFIVDSLTPKEIPIEGRPVYGNEKAPVTVVVFADFECPHCRAEAPMLRKAVDQFRGRAKLVYKHFPLGGHKRAKVAAIASEAAHAQGKFWEMHDRIFANQTRLSDEDLYEYAEKSGLDMDAFKAHFEAEKGKAVVESDRAHGEALEIAGTPAVYVDGRLYHDRLFGGSLSGWIDDALKR